MADSTNAPMYTPQSMAEVPAANGISTCDVVTEQVDSVMTGHTSHIQETFGKFTRLWQLQ